MHSTPFKARVIVLIGLMLVLLSALHSALPAATGVEAQSVLGTPLYLPLVLKNYPLPSPSTATPTQTPTSGNTLASGRWAGATNRGYSMSFGVSTDSTQWSNFKVKTDYVATTCWNTSGTIEITLPGPGNIANNQFSGSGNNFAFAGQFDSTTAAHGTYNLTGYLIVIMSPSIPPIPCLYYLYQSGTWTASWQPATATPTSSRTPTATATKTPTPTRTATQMPTATSVSTLTPTSTNTRTPTATSASTPISGHWGGTTSRGHPMSFDVSTDSAQWSNFTLKTDYVATTCGNVSGTLEITLPGPGNIANNQFSGSGNNFAFAGQFDSTTAAHGTYNFTSYMIIIWSGIPPIPCYYYLTQSGTWTANWQPATSTPTPTRTATATPLYSPTPTATPTSSTACTTYSSTDVPQAIPDPGTITSTLTVPDTFTLSDVNVVSLYITHTFDADLEAYLITPSNTEVILFMGVGGDGDDFVNTTLDDAAAEWIWFGVAPFTGSFRPEGSLSTLNGQSSVGAWRLRLTDTIPQDNGSLNGWGLELCGN